MTRADRNKALVLEAMTSLFQRHDPLAVERLYVKDYIQHNPDIPQGREALSKLVAQLPEAVYYEPGLMVAENDYVAIHGRIRGWAPQTQVVVDIFRVENGRLAEHWDVLQTRCPPAAAGPGWRCSHRTRLNANGQPRRGSRPNPSRPSQRSGDACRN